MTTWAMEEFAGAELGDERLNKRLIQLAARFADKPSASIPGACADWAETQGVYRFFDQAKDDKRSLGWQDILAPHIAQTEARMRQHPVILCLQDTTELDFNGQEISGLGPLSYEPQRGMYLHPTYAVTPEREPLGITDAWMWARQPKGADGSRPGVRESLRWTEGYERIAETALTMSETRLVYVADREAGILELMQLAHALGHPADWLIRLQHDRCLPDGGKLWAGVLVPDRSLAAWPRQQDRTRLGGVHGRLVATGAPGALGANASGTGGGLALNRQRGERCVYSGQETDPESNAHDPRGDPPDPRKKERRRTRRENPLVGLPVRQGFRRGHRTYAGASCKMSGV